MADVPFVSGDPVQQTVGLARLSDHLANERTYLAYLRTAVSLISFGIAINRFGIFLETSDRKPETPRLISRATSSEDLGIGMVLIGMALLLWALIHYMMILRQIDRQDFRPRPRSILILTTLIMICALSSVVWLFLG
jgi:putative membrane protein